MIDSILILVRVMPQRALFVTKTDIVVWTALIAIYLICMLIAMYPGCAERSRVEYSDVNPSPDSEQELRNR